MINAQAWDQEILPQSGLLEQQHAADGASRRS
jgi:hypothetical protein